MHLQGYWDQRLGKNNINDPNTNRVRGVVTSYHPLDVMFRLVKRFDNYCHRRYKLCLWLYAMWKVPHTNDQVLRSLSFSLHFMKKFVYFWFDHKKHPKLSVDYNDEWTLKKGTHTFMSCNTVFSVFIHKAIMICFHSFHCWVQNMLSIMVNLVTSQRLYPSRCVSLVTDVWLCQISLWQNLWVNECLAE